MLSNLAVLVFTLSSVFQCLCLKYDPSKVYHYSYETNVVINDMNEHKSSRPYQDVGVRILLDFELSTVYSDSKLQLFQLSISKAEVESVLRADVKRDLFKTLSKVVFFELVDDKVGTLHVSSKDSIFSRNIKKGIISLFQTQETNGERTEVDVSGECQVKYTVMSAGVVERMKTNCKNLEIAGQFSTVYKALGVSLWVKSTQQFVIKDSVIQSVNGNQDVVTYLNIRGSLNGNAKSAQIMKLSKITEGVALSDSVETALSRSGQQHELSLLPSEEEQSQCSQDCQSPKDLAKTLVEDLKAENMATLKSAIGFTRLLRSFRQSGKNTLAEIFTSSDSYYIVPQLIDVATAAQTEASHQALLELLDFTDADSVEHPQRFLFAAAYSSHPSKALITDLLAILRKNVPNENLQESLLLSLGAIVHTFCKVPEQAASPIVDEFKTLVVDGLKSCTEEACKLKYIRALGNAGLSSTVSVILPFAESSSSPMLATTAIDAFRRIHTKFITKEVKEAMLRIFNQVRAVYDSSVRVAALQFVLQHKPSRADLHNVFVSVIDQSNKEFSSYVLRLLLDSVSGNPSLREELISLLKEPSINNYNVISQRGKSSTITAYLAKMNDVNGTYNLFFENAPSGVMKRSGMLVNLVGKNMNQPFMKFGIYADGLESLMGEESAEDASDNEENPAAEPTAGMAFTFMDVLLTQVEFFRGTSGLMSAVWNAPSELTSALQGNLLLQDHSQLIHLSNGLVLDTKVLGALSMDLSGFISISLWNRNCESLIRNSGALYLEGSMSLISQEVGAGITFSGEAQTNIDFTSDVDFYEMPVKACAEMKRPEFTFVQKTQKYESLKKHTKRFRSKLRKSYKLTGESFFLNKANSEECKMMMKEE